MSARPRPPLRTVRRSLSVCVAALMAACALVLPPTATAADWQPCVGALFAVDCASYTMPLDRSGALPGTTTVRAMRISAEEGPRMGTLFAIAGGPGQTAQVMAELISDSFTGANRYDVIIVDQRGSGTSEPLNCPRVENGNFDWDGTDPTSDRPLTDCSIALGPARAAYNTAEAVADLDAVRADLGIESATFFGVSYGTKVALAYAKAHPSHTKALLLDSVLPTDMPGAFDVDSIAAARTTMRQICAGGRCRGASSRTISNTAKLASRLARRPIATYLITPQGRFEPAEIDDTALYEIVFAADIDPFVYNQLPTLLSEALRGNNAQLERLFAIINGAVDAEASRARAKAIARRTAKRARGQVGAKPGQPIGGRDSETVGLFSTAMFFATTCADFDPPWQRSGDLTGRQTAINAAAAAVPRAAFQPFSRRTAAGNGTAAYCRGWQQSPTPPAIAQGPLPDVPTLALVGGLDLRTPPAWAERAVAGDPRAQVVRIPNTGHSVIGSDLSGCALSLAKRFLIFGATDGTCRKSADPVPIAPAPARSLSDVRLLPGRCRGLRGARCLRARRHLAATYLALRDAFDQLLIGGTETGPGLYGGTWNLDYDLDDNLELMLFGVSAVPGSAAMGSIDMTMLPRIEGELQTAGMSVSINGRVRLDRRGDALTLSARRGRTRVRATVRPSLRTNGAASPTRSLLRFRRSYARVGAPAHGLLPR